MPADLQQTGTILMWLLTIAWLLPLLGFAVEIAGGSWSRRTSKLPGYFGVGCIGLGFLFSLAAIGVWTAQTSGGGATEIASAAPDGQAQHNPNTAQTNDANANDAHGTEHGHTAFGLNDPLSRAFSGTYYRIARFGEFNITLDWYIDGLTLIMFSMITLIATCIHIFSLGYMSDELTDDYEDHFAHRRDGKHVHRRGRFHQFFAYLSLFCFSMLGLILAGNIFQVFIFWELVGLCSYLLIGFYVERKSASTAANKAFIMNRIGDFGFLIGLMILWTSLGAFHFAEIDPDGPRSPGLFQLVRHQDGQFAVSGTGPERAIEIATNPGAPTKTIPYWLLTAAGLGIFAGCVGKSAQFPLQTWLPDAMEGPTPVSALVHSATMVAAGVYLVGRFYPLFTPEVLLIIAYVGCITLFIGATIALVVTDIKRVLAYSTISQLGYMMLALGVGGWMAGLFHLVTHAFFKSLMFLGSGSVIHGCHHEQDMQKMGGLSQKMPVTCWTMFVGVIAICGLAVPLIPPLPIFGPIAFSGYHSKDSILASALAFASLNPMHSLLFIVPLITAGLTAFYMFRMWFMTFFGEPRDAETFSNAHESPRIMTWPLYVLAFFTITVGIAGDAGPLVKMLYTAEPAHIAQGNQHDGTALVFPGRNDTHTHHAQAGAAALTVAFGGTILAYLFYGIGRVDVRSIQRQFTFIHRFLTNKWEFDALYDVIFVKPVLVIAHWCVLFDRLVLDALLHLFSRWFIVASHWDRKFDEAVVDRAVNVVGESTYATGRMMRLLQTGKLRHYIMSIAVSVVVLFILLFVFLPGR